MGTGIIVCGLNGAGNYISLDTACEFALKLTDHESHIPVPTRAADLMTHTERKRLKNIR